jgi:hypothetical protein
MGHRTMRWGAAALLAFASLLSAPGVAGAQGADAAQEIEGAADFRTAPLVGNGTFRDEIVTGETVWYAVEYQNDETLRIAARLADVDVDADDELTLVRSFVGPSLSEVFGGDEDIEGSAWFGGDDTNTWFVAFRLETEGELGELHDLEFELAGFTSADDTECRDDCTLDDDLAALQDEIDGLEADVEACGDECDVAEVEATRDDLAGEVDRERTAVEGLCGDRPLDSCEASSASTPWALVVVLGVAAALAVGGVARTLVRAREGDGS